MQAIFMKFHGPKALDDRDEDPLACHSEPSEESAFLRRFAPQNGMVGRITAIQNARFGVGGIALQ
jgi:hypothetical protein